MQQNEMQNNKHEDINSDQICVDQIVNSLQNLNLDKNINAINNNDNFTHNMHHTHKIEFNNIDLTNAIVNGFIETEKQWKDIASRSKLDSGAVGVFVLITVHILYVANCGDARAILCREGKPIVLTTEHSPNNKKEKNRIQAYLDKGGRLDGIGVTRAIGDYRFANDDKNECHKVKRVKQYSCRFTNIVITN